MTALLLTVGDEILLGQTVDTNAAWLGAHLPEAGLDLIRSETVGDTREAIRGALDRATERVVLVTGGLGPTTDDLTREAVAEWAGVPLVFRPELYETIAALYRRRGRPVPEAAVRAMAHAPDGFEALANPVGTAPGLWGQRGRGGRTVDVVLLPGVPREMQAIATASVLPRLASRADEAVAWRTLVTVGKPETEIAAQIAHIALPPRVGLAYLPDLGTVRVRITGRGAVRAQVEAAVQRTADALRGALGRLVVGDGADSLESVVLEHLARRGLTLATAESCTGGAIAARLTTVPGASRAFAGGVVAYSNVVKRDLLGVPEALLAEHGAVSEPVVRAMAEGARHRLGVDVGVAATGVAGPGGGTPDKPVGTVWVAVATPEGTVARQLRLTQDRVVNVGLTTTAALDLVRDQLEDDRGLGT